MPNEYSLLDKTDLVFVDAIGTGYSHGLPSDKDKIDKDKGEKEANPDKRFWGTDQDADAFGAFHAALHHGEQPLEFAEVPVRRILRHAALGRAGEVSAGQWHRDAMAWCCCRRS